MTDYDKWIFTLKNMDTMETMPFTEERNAIFARLEETAACANLTKEERELYEEQWRNYNDYYNTIDFAMEEGVAKGREEGREEGREIRSVEIAKTMKSQGLEDTLIAQCTGLSPEEIAKL